MHEMEGARGRVKLLSGLHNGNMQLNKLRLQHQGIKLLAHLTNQTTYVRTYKTACSLTGWSKELWRSTYNILLHLRRECLHLHKHLWISSYTWMDGRVGLNKVVGWLAGLWWLTWWWWKFHSLPLFILMIGSYIRPTLVHAFHAQVNKWAEVSFTSVRQPVHCWGCEILVVRAISISTCVHNLLSVGWLVLLYFSPANPQIAIWSSVNSRNNEWWKQYKCPTNIFHLMWHFLSPSWDRLCELISIWVSLIWLSHGSLLREWFEL